MSNNTTNDVNFSSPTYFPYTNVPIPPALVLWHRKFKQIGKNVFVSTGVTLEELIKRHGPKAELNAKHLSSYTKRVCTEKELAEYHKGKAAWDQAALAAKVRHSSAQLAATLRCLKDVQHQSAQLTKRKAAEQAALAKATARLLASQKELAAHKAKAPAKPAVQASVKPTSTSTSTSTSQPSVKAPVPAKPAAKPAAKAPAPAKPAAVKTKTKDPCKPAIQVKAPAPAQSAVTAKAKTKARPTATTTIATKTWPYIALISTETSTQPSAQAQAQAPAQAPAPVPVGTKVSSKQAQKPKSNVDVKQAKK